MQTLPCSRSRVLVSPFSHLPILKGRWLANQLWPLAAHLDCRIASRPELLAQSGTTTVAKCFKQQRPSRLGIAAGPCLTRQAEALGLFRGSLPAAEIFNFRYPGN